jgi:PAS domain S-box-containing protein
VAAQLGTVIQRKEAQEALRVSEEHFRAVADTAADAILSIDAEGVVCYANAAATAVFGFSAEDLQGKPLTLLLPAGVPQRGAADHRLVEVTGRRHNGDEFPIEAAFSQWSAGSDVLTTAMLRDISERKRDQAAVHEAEERFRGAFEHAPIGMALVSIESDRAGCFLRVNRALCDLVGHSAEELVGRPFAGLSDGAEAESPDARYVPWMLAGEVAEYEVEQRLQRADGKAITATVSVSLVRDAAERPLYLIVQVQDVTARKQAEQALIESRERVQAIIDNTAAVIYVKDLEGRYSLVNRSFETLFHIGRDRATGHTDEELFEPQMASSMRANDRRVMREHIPLQVEEVIDQADGPHTYLSAKFPLLDSTGKPYAVCAIATDITQRKRAEEGLRDSERHFRQIVDTAHDAFISMDATGRITAWNPQSEATFGWTEAEAVGRNLAETIIPARYRATHHRALEQFMKTGKGKLLGRRVELEALHRDGHEFPVEFTISAVRVGGTYAFNAFLHDITERKQAEETMRRLADVVQSSHDAIIATTSAGEITAWNQGAAELYGYTAEEVAGRMIEVLMPEGHSGSDGPLLAQAFAGRRLEDHETEHRRKDGSLVPVSLSVSPMRDSRRAIPGASVIVRDRTERTRAVAALR